MRECFETAAARAPGSAVEVVVEASYETQDPTVDSQVISMKAAGCEVFVNTAIPKFAAQAIRRVVEIEWKPPQILSSIGNSVAATLKPA